MQLFYQMCGLLLFFIEGSMALLILTIIGIAFTMTGAFNHRSIYLGQEHAANGVEKYKLNSSQKRQYFWLNVSGIIMVTGLPAQSITLLKMVTQERMSFDLSLWIVGLCLNLPGVIYSIQAVFLRHSTVDKWQWPRYL